MNLTKQLFVRFYIVIVISLLLAGLGLDYAWQIFSEDENEISSLELELESVAAIIIELEKTQMEEGKEKPHTSPDHKTNELETVFSTETFRLVAKSSVQSFALENAFKKDKVIILESDDHSISAYYLLPDKNRYLVKTFTPPQDETLWKRRFFLALFYLIIAVMVFFLIRPISRDLKVLEKAAYEYNHSDAQIQVNLPHSSPVNHLAKAYNQLVERIKQLLNDQKEMSHAISHELRTPLARIRFSLEMALNSDQKATKDTHLESITEDIVEIQSLVDELLSYAALEKSSAKATLERGDIASLISHQVEKHSRLKEDCNIKFQNLSDSSLVVCDNLLLERAIQNLLINAIKHCKSEVVVSFDSNQAHYFITVDDDGNGVNVEQRANIFDSFVRLDSQTPHKGFGLGLAIVKRVATLHGGNVSVEDSNLGGARFVFTWPHKSVTLF